jgi:hypothetical protein
MQNQHFSKYYYDDLYTIDELVPDCRVHFAESHIADFHQVPSTLKINGTLNI